MTIGACAIGFVAMVACTSESRDESGCDDISGNYSATAERVSGTCDPALDPTSATTFGMQRAADGTWVAVLPGIEGGCPGALDTASCKFTSACGFRDKSGAVVGNASLSYAFGARGYTGSSVYGVRPPAVATTSEVTYRETGTKL